MRAHSQSAAASIPCTGNNVVLCSRGDSGEVGGAICPDPVWTQTTVSVSSHARSSGSQWSVCTDGSPRLFMLSGNVIALKPRSALRRTSAAATSGSPSQTSCSGIMRSGYVPAHTSWCQSFHARTHARPSSGSLLFANATPANPAMSDGKQRLAQMPATSMSAMRAWMSQQPLRISSKRAGSIVHSSLGRPMTAFKPDVREQLVLVGPRLLAVLELDEPGRGVDEVRGHASLEQVGRLDEVVVDRDHGEATRARLRVGQQRHYCSSFTVRS